MVPGSWFRVPFWVLGFSGSGGLGSTRVLVALCRVLGVLR